MMIRTVSALAAASLSTLAVAQTNQVAVPAIANVVEGQDIGEHPFGRTISSSQQIVAGSAVASVFASISGISFRADSDNSIGSAAYTFPQVTVRMGHTNRDPDFNAPNGMTNTFALNVTGTMTQVFHGPLTFPAHTSTWGEVAPWIRIPFSTPFVFDRSNPAGGNLVIEIDVNDPSVPAGYTNIYIDRFFPGGYLQQYGQHGATSFGEQISILTSAAAVNGQGRYSALSPGQTFSLRFETFFTPMSGVALLGFRLPSPIDLTPAGAPGSSLYVQPLVDLPFQLQPPFFGWGYNWDLPLTVPNNPALAGAQLHAQGIIIDAAANALGLVATGGGQLVLGSLPHPINQINANAIGVPTGNFEIFQGAFAGAAAIKLDGIFQ